MVVGTARFLPSFRGAFLSAVAAAGHEVHVFAPPDAAARDWLEARGMHFHEIALSRASLRPLEDARFVPTLARRLRAVHADVLLAYHIKPVVFGVPAARLAGIPRRYAMITGLGFAFTEAAGARRRLVNAAARGLYGMSLRMVDGVVFQNEDDREAFARLGLTGKTPVHIVRSGVELDRYAATGLPAAPHFLMIARLLRDKGVGEYIAAARIVRARRPDVRFTLIGAADPNPSAFPIAEIEQAVAEGVIAHHPFVEDVRPAIAAASAFVLPSYREGTSRAALEALAMGRPVITTDAPGCRDTVIDGESGLLVPVGDAGALARAMERLADAPDEAARMGRRGRALAEARFDARSSAARLIEVLGL
jgi:glycosyltransferase involved in cell wall biosynthesis